MGLLSEEQLAGKSDPFRKFHASLQDADPRDGLQIDTEALKSLSGAEFLEAEEILMGMIEVWGGEVLEALAEIKSQRAAVKLKRLIKDAGGITAVEMALALWRIEEWPKAQEVLIDVLEGRSKYFPEAVDLEDFEASGRADAARALAHIPGEKSEAALNRAMDDPDRMVRYWAEISLNVLTGRSSQSQSGLAQRIRERRQRRKYDWLGYAIWFGGGMLLGGIPIFLHLVLHSIHFSFLRLFGLMLVCGLLGGLLWGRKHRKQWENENRADELLEEVIRSKTD
jgi:HEAT repeat protein